MEIGKIYYSMKEATELTGLPSSNLRYWEQQFSQLKPRKDGHGNRYYTKEDLELIQRIKYIRDELKITRIDAIRRELVGGEKQSDIRQRAAAILERVKEELTAIKNDL
jgi:DNA-binding transcriptional MerR regulator